MGVETAKYGKRALLVTGKNSTRKTGLLDKVKALLEKAGVDCVVFAQVSANPTSDIMEEGVRLPTEQHCDVIVALGGMNINMAGVTAPHGMEHPASGLRDIVHGRGLAALTPIIYQKSFETAPAKFDKISRLLGGKDRRELVPRIQELLEVLEVKTTLSQEGIKESDVDWMTDNCAKVSAPAMAAHPQHFTKEEIREIYLEAL